MPAAAPRPQRQLRRRERTRKALIDAGRQLATELGPDSVTVAAVTDRADLGFGTFYGHFANKDDLLAAILAEDMEAQALAIDKEIEPISDVAEQVAVGLVMTIDWLAARASWRSFIVRHELFEGALTQGVAAAIADGMANGRFSPADASTLPRIFAGTVLLATVESAPSNDQRSGFAANLLVMLGLAAPEAAQIARDLRPPAANPATAG